jgi:hypothetical protein
VNKQQTSSEYNYDDVLLKWDARYEQGKADFLDFLYDLYKPEDHCYTGLYQRFASDLIESFRDSFIAGDLKISVEDFLDDSRQPDPICEPLCDV